MSRSGPRWAYTRSGYSSLRKPNPTTVAWRAQRVSSPICPSPVCPGLPVALFHVEHFRLAPDGSIGRLYREGGQGQGETGDCRKPDVSCSFPVILKYLLAFTR